MRTKTDFGDLRMLCASIASSNFSISNRIKSISQLTHEYLGTSSIVVYAYNKATDQLDVIAMPGVAQRELMRGPTDKTIFKWEKPDSDQCENGVWLENDQDFKNYLNELSKDISGQFVSTSEGSFREREIEKERRRLGDKGQDAKLILATAKIYLLKGLEQTCDKVGQIYYNFVSQNNRHIFTSEVKPTIRFVSDIIRELLIDSTYHQGLPQAHWKPEHLMREINNVFDKRWQSPGIAVLEKNAQIQADQTLEIQHDLADIIRNAALSATENYGGYADFILLIGQKLGRVFSGHPDPKKSKAVLIHNDWISEKCIREVKFFIGNDIEFDEDTKEKNLTYLSKDKSKVNKWENEIESVYYRSLMVVPVQYAGEVKALIRLTSPKGGCFLDEQARAMKTLVQMAQLGLVRLDELKQRERVSSALDFYTSRMSAHYSGNIAFLMEGVLSALGAEWGTFWPIDYIDPNGKAQITHGIKFFESSTSSGEKVLDSEDIFPNDSKVGIRGLTTGDDYDSQSPGFSNVLIRENLNRDDSLFFTLHVLKPSNIRYSIGEKSDFYLQAYTKGELPSWAKLESNRKTLPDGFKCGHIKEGDPILDNTPLNLSENTTEQIHTRIAFVVSVDNSPKALVWLKFPDLHEVPWWERRYILGLSSSLGRLLQVDALEVAIKSFRHMIPSWTQEIRSSLDIKRETIPPLVDNFVFNMAYKCQEVKAVLASLEKHKDKEEIASLFNTEKFEYYVQCAKDSATGFAANQGVWDTIYSDVKATNKVCGVFYCVLLNLLNNVIKWGWKEIPVAEQHAVIWIHAKGKKYYVCVANTGNAYENKVGEKASPITDEHGVGLRVSKSILQLFDGDITHIPKSTYIKKYPKAPESIKTCETIIEFYFRK